MKNNLKGELAVMDSLDTKPNYAALGRKYGMDWRTVKKYHNGYEGRPDKRNKGSKLDEYRNEIKDKLAIKRITVQGVYQFMLKKYGVNRIGSYSNFNRYVTVNKLKPKARTHGHPRFEKNPREQAQVDWNEDISITNIYGEKFVINVLHTTLKYSRYAHLEMTAQKRFDDVARGLINSFRKFGGVPKELLFDNMATVSNTNVTPKKPTDSIMQMAKDFGFKVRLCKARSPQTKGTVEARNKIIDWIRAYEGEFETIEELEVLISAVNKDMNISINQETKMSPTALFYKEKEYLKPLPHKSIIDTYLTPNRYRVSSEALIRFNGKRYSVDPKLIDEEVTVDRLDNRLYIYYNGKLVTIHALNDNPVNYKKYHYEQLMKGKINDADMETVVTGNLKMMDRLLDSRKVTVTEKDAVKSEEALIAYINQSDYGRWIINSYAHLSDTDKVTFRKGINEVLPYIDDRELFISHIKYSMKSDMCRNLAYDCVMEDCMRMDNSPSILCKDGFEFLYDKYKDKIYKDIAQMAKDWGLDDRRETILPEDSHKPDMNVSTTTELPFDTDKEN